VENPQQIAGLAASQSRTGAAFPIVQEFRQIRAQSKGSFSDVIANGLSLDGIATQGQQPQRILILCERQFLFNAWVEAAAGRLFLPARRSPGQSPVIVLGTTTGWRNSMATHVVGRPVAVDGHLYDRGRGAEGFHGVQSFVSVAAFYRCRGRRSRDSADVVDKWDIGMNCMHAAAGVSMQQARRLGVIAREMSARA